MVSAVSILCVMLGCLLAWWIVWLDLRLCCVFGLDCCCLCFWLEFTCVAALFSLCWWLGGLFWWVWCRLVFVWFYRLVMMVVCSWFMLVVLR